MQRDIEKFISNYSVEDELMISFAWNGKYAEELVDENLSFRRLVLNHFKEDPSAVPVELIVAMYDAETALAKEAWAVSPLVSLLAQEMLERGRTEYVTDYLKGWARGMDAYIQSQQIELSDECINDLIMYGKSQKNDFPLDQQMQRFIQFLEYNRELKN